VDNDALNCAISIATKSNVNWAACGHRLKLSDDNSNEEKSVALESSEIAPGMKNSTCSDFIMNSPKWILSPTSGSYVTCDSENDENQFPYKLVLIVDLISLSGTSTDLSYISL
jgi:hypothetical protein